MSGVRSWSRRGLDRLLVPPARIRPMGLIAVQMSINPFELYFLLAIVLVGFAYAVGFPPPGSVAQLLPEAAVRVWAANLGIGGSCALIGGLWYRNLERGLASYQFGWGLVGTGSIVYALALWLVFPVTGVYPAVTNLLFAAACLTRVVQVQRFFRLSQAVPRGELRGGTRPRMHTPPPPRTPGRGSAP